jgi:hypothetical protein
LGIALVMTPRRPVGGRAFKLPENAAIGYAYILFVVSLLMIFIGELFALKIIFAQ